MSEIDNTPVVKVSIKPGTGYDWVEFNGSVAQVKVMLKETYGLTMEGTLHEVFLAAQAAAQGRAAVVVSKPEAKASPKAPQDQVATAVPASITHDEAVTNAVTELGAEVISDEVAEPEHEHQELLNEIASMSSKGKLAMLLRDPEKNKVIMPGGDPDVRAAFKAKSAAL